MADPARRADYLRETVVPQHVLKLSFKAPGPPDRRFLGCYNMFTVSFQCKTMKHTPHDSELMNMGAGRTFNVLIRLATSELTEEQKFKISASAWIGPSSSDTKPRIAAGCGMVIDDNNCVTVNGPFEPVMIKLPAIQSTMPVGDDDDESDDECGCCESEARVLFPGLVLSVVLQYGTAYVSLLPPRHLAHMQITQLHSTAYVNVDEGGWRPENHTQFTIPGFIPTPPPLSRPAALTNKKRKTRAVEE